MDTQTLIEALRNLLPDEMEWKFALYSTYKSRDRLELDWSLCKMKDIASWVDMLKITLLEKTTAEKSVTEYSPFVSDKEHIGALEKTNDLIRDQVVDILLNIQNGLAYAPEDFLSGAMSKPAGFAFYGERKNKEGNVTDQVLFMRRGNPFMSSAKVRLCTSEGDEVITSEKPLLKFTPAMDFLLIGGVCYFLSATIEKDFEMENRHFAIAGKCMGLIADATIVSNYEKLEEVVMKAKNAKKFIDFDNKVLEHIARLSIIEREDFLSTYGITIDNNGYMDTSDPEQCELIIDLLCARSIIDPLGRLSVVSGIMPRE